MLQILVLGLVLTSGLSEDGVAPSLDPGLDPGVLDPEVTWRRDVLESIQRLVQVQTEVLKLLGILGNQGSLLVENHQALLLQTSRIATNLQEMTRRTPPPPQEVSRKTPPTQQEVSRKSLSVQ